MTKTLNQIIFFSLQNIFFSNIGNQNIFFRKNTIPPFPRKLNGPSLRKEVEKNITCVIVLAEPIPEFRGIEISVIRWKAMHKNEAN